MKKKKLLITGSTFPRWESDTEPRFILDYAKAMSRFYDVTVLVPAAIGAKDNEILEGIKVKRFHYFPIHRLETLCYPGAIVPRIKQKKIRIVLVPFLIISMFLSLRKICRDFDFIHSHWLIPQGIVQSFIKTPNYIVTGHGGDVTSLNNFFIKKLKIRTLEKAAKITVVSADLYEHVQKMYPNKKTSVISMGCDTRQFASQKRTNNYFGQNDKKVVLFVGRLAEKKGVTYLIEAIKDVENAILVIVGKGELETELREQAKELGERIIFWGPRTHQELPEIYASADVFVVPSITSRNGDKEGFGLVIIEAMSSGVPVVASKSGGICDIIQNNVNGLLCEEKSVRQLADNINSVLNDPDLACRLKANGAKTAQKYSYENIAEQYKQLFEELA